MRVIVPAAIALAYAIGAELVPQHAVGRSEGVLDLVVGLVPLGIGLLLIGRDGRSPIGFLIAGAGIAWFLPNFAVSGSESVDFGLRSLTLLHVALLASAILVCCTHGELGRLSRAAVAFGFIAAASAFGGPYEVLQPLAATALLIATAALLWHSSRLSQETFLAACGAGLIAGAEPLAGSLVRSLAGFRAEHALVLAHDAAFVMAVVLVAFAELARPVDATELALAIGQRGSLEHAVAQILGDRNVQIALPDGESGWIDARGERVGTPPATAIDLCDREVLAARITTDAAIAGALGAALARSLARAGANARLRREALDQVEAIAASRRRLVDAATSERRELEAELRAGPLTRLASIERSLAGNRLPGSLAARVLETRRALEDIARGLDPLAGGMSLRDALTEMASRAPASVSADISAAPADGAAARVIWFACAEAIANAAKHAPGASVRMAVTGDDGGTRLHVVDDGPGGADPAGTGLRGLADRVAALGGRVVLTSAAGAGTSLVVELPARGYPVEQLPGSTLVAAPAAG